MIQTAQAAASTAPTMPVPASVVAHTAAPPMPLETAGGWFQAMAALGFVVLLFLAFAWLLQKLQRRGVFGAVPSADPNLQLAMLQSMPVDAKSRMVLVRRGRVGHLLYLHAQGATLVESGIALTDEEVVAIAPAEKTPPAGPRPRHIILKEPLR